MADLSTREPGWYWVKFGGTTDTWIPCYWGMSGVGLAGFQTHGIVTETGPRIYPPGEDRERDEIALTRETPIRERADLAAHALIHMAGEYEGYDQRKQRYAAAFVAFGKESVARRMIAEANERRTDDALCEELLAALEATENALCIALGARGLSFVNDPVVIQARAALARAAS